MVKNYIPERGDIIWIDLNPKKGHEQDGRRPALVLSPIKYNQITGMMLACPITNQIKNYPFEVVLSESQKTQGALLVDHIRNLDWQARQIKFIEKLESKDLEIALAKAQTLLD